MKLTLQHLRRQAISASLFPPTTLSKAIEQLGFVQADPIRSPARAQDLILRHRVKSYRAGDLEARYPTLQIEEDFLYAYGFMPQATWSLLHPRLYANLTDFEERVLDLVRTHKRMHPRELEAHLGKERELNAWGGYSKATTQALQALHYRGILRVAGRENGIRLYEASTQQNSAMEPGMRLTRLILLIASILQPVPERSLRAALQLLGRAAPALQGRHSTLTGLIESGALTSTTVDGLRYVWPAGRVTRKAPDQRVRFLAPFDPLVWDRLCFEHLWEWRYRFEAYTPAPKRKLGYYAMPLLWRGNVVGWVNISNRSNGLSVNTGFATAKPDDPAFHEQFDAEVERFRDFLAGRNEAGTRRSGAERLTVTDS